MPKNTKHKLLSTLTQFNNLKIAEQLDYNKFYLYSIITHSTAIEGSTVTEVENQLLFDEGISSNKPMAEQLMNLDLKLAYEKSFLYAKNHETFSVKMLCALSSIVMKNTGVVFNTIAGDFSSANGELRLVNVSTGRGGKSYVPFQKVPAKLEEYCEIINSRRKSIDPNDIYSMYQLSFDAHHLLVQIHPWADGNGRMSRLIMNQIQMEYGIIPSYINKEHKVQYIESLIISDEIHDTTPFNDFMFKEHMDILNNQIIEYQKSLDDNNVINGGQKKWSETTIRVLELIKENPQVTRKTLCEKLAINPSAIQKHIDKLKKENVIQRVGPDKGGYWEVILEVHNDR